MTAKRKDEHETKVAIPWGYRDTLALFVTIGGFGLLLNMNSDIAVIKSREGTQVETRRIADSALSMATRHKWKLDRLEHNDGVTQDAVAGMEHALWPNDYRRWTANYDKRRKELYIGN